MDAEERQRVSAEIGKACKVKEEWPLRWRGVELSSLSRWFI